MTKDNKFDHGKMYGSTVMGSRGQVVIPAEARKDLDLKPGDRLVVIGKMDKVLGIMKAEEMAEFIKQMMANLEEFNRNTDKILKNKVN